jgi:hypothetical protein
MTHSAIKYHQKRKIEQNEISRMLSKTTVVRHFGYYFEYFNLQKCSESNDPWRQLAGREGRQRGPSSQQA